MPQDRSSSPLPPGASNESSNRSTPVGLTTPVRAISLTERPAGSMSLPGSAQQRAQSRANPIASGEEVGDEVSSSPPTHVRPTANSDNAHHVAAEVALGGHGEILQSSETKATKRIPPAPSSVAPRRSVSGVTGETVPATSGGGGHIRHKEQRTKSFHALAGAKDGGGRGAATASHQAGPTSLPQGMTGELMRRVAALDITRMSCEQV